MNKVKCINGHFFDLDKFSCCPICNGGVDGQTDNRKSRTPVEPLQQSQLDDVDKTMLLVETPPAVEQETPKPSGKWSFWKKKKDVPENEPAAEPPQPEPQPQNRHFVQPQESSIPAEKPVSRVVSTRPQNPPQDQNIGTLTQAVAATGYSTPSALPKTTAYYDLVDTEPPTAWLVCVKGAYQGQAFTCKSGRNKIGRNPNCNINLINDASITREPHAMVIYDPKQRTFYLQNGTGDGLVYLNGSLLFSHEQLHAYDKIQIGNAEFVFFPLCGEQFTWDDYIS